VGVKLLPAFPMARWPQMQAFLAARYRPDLALCNRAFFEWFFRGGTGSADVASAWDGDRLVGTMGYVANPVFWGRLDAPLSGAWLVNWAVDPAYRHGTGIALMREMQQRFMVLLGIGAGAENERIVARLGWAIVPYIQRYVAVFDPKQTSVLALPGAEGTIPAAFDQSLAAAGVREWRPEDPEPLWEQYPALAHGTVRSPAYLRWRYLEHPVFAFTLLAAGDEQTPAVAAYRIERAAGSGVRAGRILEFFHPEDSRGTAAGIRLARALAARLAAEGCAFADFVCSTRTYGETLVAAGWSPEDPKRMCLPMRLQPVERVPFRYNLEYGVPRALERPESGSVYCTRGDGDADRPASDAK
jgi:hypothetical protein